MCAAKMRALAVFFATSVALCGGQNGGQIPLEVGTDTSHCEDISVPLCRNLPYQRTQMPNHMGNQNQDEAEHDIHQYTSLVKLKCSPDIQLFICAMFTPACTIIKKALPPCRELCESAKKGCEPLMIQFDYSWPTQFDCDRFPRAHTDLCVDPDNNATFSKTELEVYQTTTVAGSGGPDRPDDYTKMMDFVCPAALKVPPEYEYSVSIGRKPHVVEDCGAPCYRLFFSPETRDYVRGWVVGWAAVCLVSSLFTLATFFLDTERFPYPEKPIVYLSMCYLVVAIVYLVGYLSGDSIACNQDFHHDSNNRLSSPSSWNRVLKQGTLHDWRCSIMGMLLYFFYTAGCIWWVVLTVAWYLSAGLKWGQESIDVIASYFHAVVWTLASLQTIMVLILKKIEGDILSGVCFVGQLDADSLLYLIIVPSLVYLAVGFVFLVMAFAYLLQVRSIMNRDGTSTDKLERLMMRIGTFSLLYMVSAGVVVGCYIYEYSHLPDWMSLWQERSCRDETLVKEWQVHCRYPDNQIPAHILASPPNSDFFVLKYVMTFGIGIVAGFWVWSGKSIATWRKLCCNLFGGAQYRREAHV